MLRLVLVCEESAGIRAFERVAAMGHEIVALLTTSPESGPDRSRLWEAACRRGYDPAPSATVKDPGWPARLRELEVDMLLNVYSRYIIPAPALSAPRIGAFNLHPGPLPRYAGLNAPSWAIFRGETRHGVTLHRMEPGIDTGPIVHQDSFDVPNNATGLWLFMECVRRGLPLLDRLLDQADATGTVPETSQDTTQREYFGNEVPWNGRVTWASPARAIDRFVRACDFRPFPSPWGEPLATLDGEYLSVLSVALTGLPVEAAAPGTVRQDDDGRPLVATADEWLSIAKIGLKGRKARPEEVLRTGVRLD